MLTQLVTGSELALFHRELALERGETCWILRVIPQLRTGIHRADEHADTPEALRRRARLVCTPNNGCTRPLRSRSAAAQASMGEFQAPAAKTRRASTSRLHARTLQCRSGRKEGKPLEDVILTFHRLGRERRTCGVTLLDDHVGHER